MKYAFRLGLLGILIVSAVVFYNQLRHSNLYPIKTVRIFGAAKVDQSEVQAMLEPLVNRGFFSINVESIRDKLKQQPWASDVFVRRSWPDKIEVNIVEREAMAKWSERTLLSNNGELFTPKKDTIPPNLPSFSGPDGKQVIMLSYFKEMNRIFSPLRVKISYLEMTPYLTWKVRLDNGVTLQMGHKDVLTRLDHFVKVYPKIIGSNANSVEYVDLRYPNGVAIRWKAAVQA